MGVEEEEEEVGIVISEVTCAANSTASVIFFCFVERDGVCF